jgi:hypothetical protein
MSREEPCGMQQMMDEDKEIIDYSNAKLLPIVKEYVHNYYTLEDNKKWWRVCDMWFTAFLTGRTARFLWRDLNDSNTLHMEALRAWYEALCREDNKHESLLPPRVHDAERILQTLVEGRRAKLQEGTYTLFDSLVVVTDELCKKECKLYCLWLTFVVQCDCPALRSHSSRCGRVPKGLAS